MIKFWLAKYFVDAIISIGLVIIAIIIVILSNKN